MTADPFAGLEAALRALARSGNGQQTEPVATNEQIDLVSLLLVLSTSVRKFCAVAVTDPGSADWGALASVLDDAARACRHETVIEVDLGSTAG